MRDSGCRGTVDAGLRVCSFILLALSALLYSVGGASVAGTVIALLRVSLEELQPASEITSSRCSCQRVRKRIRVCS